MPVLDVREAMILKVKKQLPVGMAVELEAMDAERLKGRIVMAGMIIKDTELARKRDQDLVAAKETVKELDKPYKDALKAHRAIAMFASLELENRGN